MKEKQGDLKREIGFWGLSTNIINVIIGAGIFVLPAIVAADLGAASILAYVFCSILIILLMLCYAEVGSKITATGGVYIYIEKAFGKYPAFLIASLMLLATIASDAAVANAIIDIVFKLFPFLKSELIRILFFFFLFGGLAYVNVIGVKKGVGLVQLLTCLKIIPLLLIILIGIKDVELTNLVWETTPSISQIGATSLVLYFAFTGAGSALSVSGEVRNPQKTIPRAILFSILIVGIIYMLVQTVAQGVLGVALPSFTENPLGEVAKHIFGPIGFTLLTIGAAVSMFGSISSKVLSVPRVLFAVSKDKLIPITMLSKVHHKYATPYISIITYTALGFLLASLGGFKQLAIISSAAALVISFSISIATIKLRRDKHFNSDPEAFKIPGGYIVPILSTTVILWFLSNLSIEKIMGLGLFIVFITIVYFFINSIAIRNRIGKNNHD